MAEFFGPMKESSCDIVEIQGVEPEAFKAMLHFIYTDTCPDFFAHQYNSNLGGAGRGDGPGSAPARSRRQVQAVRILTALKLWVRLELRIHIQFTRT
jgi:hypothetical protein